MNGYTVNINRALTRVFIYDRTISAEEFIDIRKQIYNWLDNNAGQYIFTLPNGNILFRDEEDFIAFKLRFGEYLL